MATQLIIDTVIKDTPTLEQLEDTRRNIQEKVIVLKQERTALEERTKLETENGILRQQMNKIKNQLTEISGAVSTCPFCGQVLDHNHRIQLIEKLTIEGMSVGDLYRNNDKKLREINNQLQHFISVINDIEFQISRLSNAT